jgi:hypothetical protein
VPVVRETQWGAGLTHREMNFGIALARQPHLTIWLARPARPKSTSFGRGLKKYVRCAVQHRRGSLRGAKAKRRPYVLRCMCGAQSGQLQDA